MIAVGAIARQWRGGLLGLVLLSVTLLIAIAALDEQPPSDRLPLRGVRESEYARADVAIVPAYEEQAAMGASGAQLVAKYTACCGVIKQTVLVRLKRADSTSPGVLSYAVSFDTSTAPDYPATGGQWRTGFTRATDYFVLFLDASSGAQIYSLFPGSEYPFPEPESQESLVLYSVPPELIASSDIMLRKPPAGAVPTLNEDNARNYVMRRFPGATVRQLVLGELTESSGGVPAIYEELVWVVSLNPDSLSMPVLPAVGRSDLRSSGAPQFALVFIDAKSGEFVYFLSR